jgi:hypothetical protein
MLEQRLHALSPYATQYEIAKTRLIIILTRYPGYVVTLTGRIPVHQLAQEVANETPLGQQLIQIEMQRMRQQLEMF